MPTFAIVADDCTSRAQYLDRKQLPVKYMEDFTLPGFIVNEYEKACTLLRQEGYTLLNCATGADILIENASQIRSIKALLDSKDITATFSDIADTLYQA